LAVQITIALVSSFTHEIFDIKSINSSAELGIDNLVFN